MPTGLPNAEALIDRIRAGTGDAGLTTVDGQRLAVALMGDAIAANMMMVGIAWQKGLIPLSRAAIERAIELNGVSVAMNRKAFHWGRCIADDPARVERLVSGGQVIQFHRREAAATLDDTVARRVGLSHRVPGCRSGEALHRPGRRGARAVDAAPARKQRLATAVAHGWFKLLAVKDEWEVARLYTSDAFRKELEQTFEGDYTLHFHVGAWPFARTDPTTGRPVKREVGPWLMRVFGVMATPARAARLVARSVPQRRGTPSRCGAAHAVRTGRARTDRRAERRQLRHGSGDRVAAAKIRGFGHVRQASADTAGAERARLLQQFANPIQQIRRAG